MELSELDEWANDFETFHSRFAPLFGRQETREQAVKYLSGLISPVERKNNWQLAGAVGDKLPAAPQEGGTGVWRLSKKSQKPAAPQRSVTAATVQARVTAKVNPLLSVSVDSICRTFCMTCFSEFCLKDKIACALPPYATVWRFRLAIVVISPSASPKSRCATPVYAKGKAVSGGKSSVLSSQSSAP